jgi:hypothetical protein
MHKSNNSLNTKAQLSVGDDQYHYFSLQKLADQGLIISDRNGQSQRTGTLCVFQNYFKAVAVRRYG